jgi:hypothetical protein
MIQFLDTTDLPLSSMSMTFYGSTDTLMSVRFDCRTGYALSAVDVPAGLTVYARFLGDTVWQNIGTTPLSLSAFDGLRKTIEIKYTAGVIASPERDLFKLRIGRI